jgi:hypothetical protein
MRLTRLVRRTAVPSRPAVAAGLQSTALNRDASPRLRDEDDFGHDDYARAAAQVLTSAPAPFTLGIFGDWGIGKTAIIGAVGDHVREAGAAYVEFDVWRYEGEAVRRQFLREVAEQLGSNDLLRRRGIRRRKYAPERELRDLEVDVPVSEERFHLSWRGAALAGLYAVVLGAAVLWLLRSSLSRHIWGRPIGPSSTADEAAVLVAAVSFLLSILRGIFRVDQRSITVRRIEEPERFQEKFEELLTICRAKRVVIAIDNLDRCGPHLVDQFLATIKTFLEPAIEAVDVGESKTEVVFVIAADEAAVRRHMLAREFERSHLASISPDSDDDSARVREAEHEVDEYLRKFFNATIRVRPLLLEDARGFAAKELRGFFVAHGLTDASFSDEVAAEGADDLRLNNAEVRDRLVGLTVAGLRRNPRRIRQFANNLDVRLLTIEAREASGRIRPRISDDILGIAKLAIIEEEWRDDYEALERDHRKLAEWQATVITGDLPNRELTAFLRSTRDVVPRNVSAILSLKLETDELELPDLGKFRDAIAYGDFATARAVINEAPDGQENAYSVRLPDLLARELSNDAFAEAANVLEASLQDPPLGLGSGDALRRMFSDATARPLLVKRFTTLNVPRLFGVLRELTAAERRTARQPFLNLAGILPQNPEMVGAVCLELAHDISELNDEERRILRDTIGVNPASTALRSRYLPLVEADPSLLTESAVASAMQTVPTASAGGLGTENPEVRVIILGLSQGLGANSLTPFFDSLNAQLGHAFGTDKGTAGAIEVIAIALRQMVIPAPDTPLTAILEAIRGNLAAVAGTTPEDGGIEQVVAVLASSATAAWRDAANATAAAEQLAVELTAQHPTRVARGVSLQRADFAQGVRANITAELTTVLGRTPLEYDEFSFAREPLDASDWHDVARGLLLLQPESGPDLLRDDLERRIQSNQFDGVDAITRALADPLGKRVRELAASIRARLGDLDGEVLVAGLTAYVSMCAQLGDLETARALIREQLFGAHSHAFANALRADTLTTTLGDAETTLLAEVRDGLIGSEFSRDALGALQYVADGWSRLGHDKQTALRGTIVRWINSDPDWTPEITATLDPVSMTTQQRGPVVRALLRAARGEAASEEESVHRADALVSAYRVADDSRPLRKLCEEGLEKLTTSPTQWSNRVAELARVRLAPDDSA